MNRKLFNLICLTAALIDYSVILCVICLGLKRMLHLIGKLSHITGEQRESASLQLILFMYYTCADETCEQPSSVTLCILIM